MDEELRSMKLALNPREAAESLGISPRKLWQLTADGSIPSVKIGKCRRYRVDDLRRWLAAGCPTESSESEVAAG